MPEKKTKLGPPVRYNDPYHLIMRQKVRDSRTRKAADPQCYQRKKEELKLVLKEHEEKANLAHDLSSARLYQERYNLSKIEVTSDNE